MDINSGFIAIAVILVAIALVSLWSGIRDIQSARKMTFFRLRHQRMASGWRLFGLALVLGILAIALPIFGEPVAYQYFPPSPTITLTPSITLIPTITLTPSITVTPSITLTPAQSATFTPTSTPFLPLPVLALFQSNITPNPQAVFSSIQFTTSGNKYPAISPATVFQNPVGHMYAIFSYDNMLPGVQWTAIWYRDSTQVHLETRPWDGGTGGYGFTDWNPQPYEWLPGNYEVQIFVGEDWKVVGRFIVQGNSPPAPPTSTPTFTPSPTRTPRSTGTP
ncbi:MAG: hypothetical protein WCA79_14910 [Anaerolineales bacterium]